jgi:HK97 family phage portal protein
MNLFKKIKLAFSNNFDDMVRQYMAGEDVKPYNGYLSESNALQFSTFFACLRVLAETFASVSIAEYKKQSDGDRLKTDDTGLYDILHFAPNDEMSSYNYLEQMMYQINLGGNSISQRIVNGFDGITGLYPLNYNQVEIARNKDTGKLEYKYTTPGRETKIFSRSEIFHVPGPSINGVTGMSILEYAMNSLKLGYTYEQFGQKFFENGALPSGVFSHPGTLNDTAYDRLKTDIDKKWTGLHNAGRPILTEDGLQFKEIPIKLVDAELLSSKKWQAEEICRFCRMPPHMIQNLERSTFSNIEHQSLEFVMYTMLPHFKRVEECINTQLLSRNQRKSGYYFEFNMSTLLRGDQASMANAFAIGRQWGWLSVNDIRRMLNMNAIPNGDTYLEPLNMIEAGTEREPTKEVMQEVKDLIKGMRI